MAKINKPKLALILGSGFSCEAGLPRTSKITKSFLDNAGDDAYIEKAITSILQNFWEDVFGYKVTNEKENFKPSLEDHFTMLDLSANTGHHLGKRYSPKKMRAIRRMSIHRVFHILEQKYNSSDSIKKLFTELCHDFDLSIISLNWDIVAENHLLPLRQQCHYGIEVFEKDRSKIINNNKTISLLKMHSSANWEYCDSCRRVYVNLNRKSAYYSKAYLENDDFKLFDFDDVDVTQDKTKCPHCDNNLAGRLVTFSFRKAFSIPQFQALWEQAHTILSDIDSWLFIGYSMPDADFEFKHLLKSAQLARKEPKNWSASVILKDDAEAEDRYKSFFGLKDDNIYQGGLSNWVDSELKDFKIR